MARPVRIRNKSDIIGGKSLLPARAWTKKDRYGSTAKKVQYDGHVFDSRAEYRRYLELVILQRAGRISGLVVHPVYSLVFRRQILIRSEGYPNGRQAKFTPDFRYMQGGKTIVEDVKGAMTARDPAFLLRRAVFEAIHYPVKCEIIKAGK
jgi:hypothetical protein